MGVTLRCWPDSADALQGQRQPRPAVYVPPVVAKQIQDLGIRAREVFEICKAELREDNKRWIEWHVKKIRATAASGIVGKRIGRRGHWPERSSPEPPQWYHGA